MSSPDGPGATRCGYVAIVGRPNTGKSTLLNALVGVRLASVAPKPQTTRHNISGILTRDAAQIVFVDTPGLHLHGKRLLNRMLNDAACIALQQVDLVLLLVDRDQWGEEDEFVLRMVREAGRPCVLCINKIDGYRRERLLPVMERLRGKYDFEEIIPVSARRGENLDVLEREVRRRMPFASFLFPEDQVSSRSERFIAAELIREQLIRNLHQEVPHSLYVEIEAYREREGLSEIAAVIWVDRPSQRSIVIGRQGQTLTRIGAQARRSLEQSLGHKVFLKLWVKDRADWQDNEAILASFDSKLI
ncbi:MAG: GTPase Era [Pseudomonadota bacterium]|nr:GTPase Era [Pseudomonadota bacterium]